MTPEEIDEIAKDSNDYGRHLLFIRFVLGEPLRDAIWMAFPMRNVPLSLESMRHVAAGWFEDL